VRATETTHVNMLSVSLALHWLYGADNNLRRTQTGKVKEHQSGLLEYARGVYVAALGRMQKARDMHY
jgi:hypothetical protein